MPQIKIKIGCALDQSARSVFKPLVQAAVEARKAIQKEFASVSIGMRGSFTEGARVSSKAFSDTSKAGEAMSRELARQASRRTRMAEQESKREYATTIRLANETSRERIRILNANNRLELASARQLERDKRREAAAGQRTLSKFADRTSYGAARFLTPHMPIMSMARRAGADVLRGVGVDLDPASSIARNVELSQRVTQLQNQASLNNQDISHESIFQSIAKPSDKYGFGRMGAANALGGFADRTGDMKLGVDVLPALAERAAASGGSLEDMLDAAGEVAMNLGPVKDKAKSLIGVFDAMIVQGAKGAIEMKNLAQSGMARIASSAGLYEGDAGENMKKLGALAQLARQSGGAAKPAEAATAISRMTGQFSTGARVKAFKAAGVDVFSKTEKGQYRDPIEIIKDALLKTGGDPMKMNKMFMSSIGAKPVIALSKTFNEAGGGAKGIEAINKVIASFMATEDIQAKLDAANKRRDEETAVKVQKFQNKLDDVTKGAMTKLLPALEQLEGPALRLAGHLGDLASWVASNPGQALIDAVGLVILRSGMENAFRHGIETVIKDLGSKAGGLGGLGADKQLGSMTVTGGLVGAISSAAVIAAFSFAIYEAGKTAISMMFKTGADSNRADAEQTGNDGAALANAVVAARKGEYDPESKAALEKAVEHTKKKIEESESTDVGYTADPMGGDFGGNSSSGSRADNKEVLALREELKQMTVLLDQIKNGQLKVHVVNMPPPEMPKAPTAGGSEP